MKGKDLLIQLRTNLPRIGASEKNLQFYTAHHTAKCLNAGWQKLFYKKNQKRGCICSYISIFGYPQLAEYDPQ